MTCNRALTLIELLVVLAIIGVLASLLAPMAQSIRNQGRDLRCQANQRQVGMCSLQFASEHDGRIVPYNTADGSWPVQLIPYLGATWGGEMRTGELPPAPFACPYSTRTVGGWDGANAHVGINCMVSGAVQNRFDAGRVALAMDAHGREIWTSTPGHANSPEFRHRNATVQAVFLDNHVEAGWSSARLFAAAQWWNSPPWR